MNGAYKSNQLKLFKYSDNSSLKISDMKAYAMEIYKSIATSVNYIRNEKAKPSNNKKEVVNEKKSKEPEKVDKKANKQESNKKIRNEYSVYV